jgi:hypothetical protein
MAEDVPLEEPPEPAPESSSGGFAQFMCCSTDSMDKDGSRAPVDMFCFKGRAEEDVDAPVDPPGDDDATAENERPGDEGEARAGGAADEEAATWAREGEKQAHIFGEAPAPAAAAAPQTGDDAAPAPPPAPGKRRASMAPKPPSEKKRMSIFEAMQASVASAAGMGADDEEAIVLEAVLHKKGSGGGLIFGKSAAFKKRKFELVKHCPVWIPNLQPDFNVSVCDGFDARFSAVLRELDESTRSVQKSAESTSM